MIKVFYDPLSKGFYQSDFHKDIPSSAIEITNKLRWELVQGQSEGKEIFIQDGIVGLVSKTSSISDSQIESLRLQAYADPVTGSDRYFSESMSLQVEGCAVTSVEVKAAKAKGLARKKEIQAQYPWQSK